MCNKMSSLSAELINSWWVEHPVTCPWIQHININSLFFHWSDSADVCLCVCVCVKGGHDTTEAVLDSRPGLSAHTGSLLALECLRFQRCILLWYFSESTLSFWADFRRAEGCKVLYSTRNNSLQRTTDRTGWVSVRPPGRRFVLELNSLEDLWHIQSWNANFKVGSIIMAPTVVPRDGQRVHGYPDIMTFHPCTHWIPFASRETNSLFEEQWIA